MMRIGNVVAGLLAGLAVGVIAGILLAPEKGTKTRKQIRDKADDYVVELKTKYHRLRESLRKKFERTKKEAEGLVDKGKAKYYDAEQDLEITEAKFKNPGRADNSF